MLTNGEINQALNELRKILDTYEVYAPNTNVGYKTLKNIGAWLLLFALTDVSDQNLIIEELIVKAGAVSESTENQLEKIICYLIAPSNLKTIIEDYEQSNGTFVIEVKDSTYLNHVLKASENLGLSDIVRGRFSINNALPEQGALSIKMQAKLAFSWAGRNADSSEECAPSLNYFNGVEVDYLSATDRDHSINYGLIEYKNKLYHVAMFTTLQKNNAGIQDAVVNFIEPVNPDDRQLLHHNYYDIISAYQTSASAVLSKSFDKSQYEKLKALQKMHNIKNLKFEESVYKSDVRFYDTNVPVFYTFHLNFNFPKIASKLETIENRLGSYSVFLNKKTASVINTDIVYHGVRSVIYDEKGGKIENEEYASRLFTKAAALKRQPKIFITVTITYDILNQYLLAYTAPEAADCFPFMIADPNKNLKMSFQDTDKIKTGYDQARLFQVGSSRQSSILGLLGFGKR